MTNNNNKIADSFFSLFANDLVAVRGMTVGKRKKELKADQMVDVTLMIWLD